MNDKYTVIIAAAGVSNRFNIDKLLIKINNIETIKHTVNIFLEDHDCNHIIIASSNKNYDLFKSFFHLYKKVLVVKGGETRFLSVKQAISYLKRDAENVLIHDGARPFLTSSLLDKIKNSLINENHQICIPYIDIYDSCIDIKANKYINRDNIKLIQTPQAFKKNLIVNSFINTNNDYHDEYSMILDQNPNIKSDFVLGSRSNIKITTFEDLDFIQWEK